jgi:hypothetical protein
MHFREEKKFSMKMYHESQKEYDDVKSQWAKGENLNYFPLPILSLSTRTNKMVFYSLKLKIGTSRRFLFILRYKKGKKN